MNMGKRIKRIVQTALRFSFDCQLRQRKFEVGSSKFESGRYSRDFLMIVVNIAMSSLASVVSGSNRSFGTTSETDNSRNQYLQSQKRFQA